MPQTAGGALIGMQFFYNAVFLDITDHIFGLLKGIVDLLFARRADWIDGLKI